MRTLHIADDLLRLLRIQEEPAALTNQIGRLGVSPLRPAGHREVPPFLGHRRGRGQVIGRRQPPAGAGGEGGVVTRVVLAAFSWRNRRSSPSAAATCCW